MTNQYIATIHGGMWEIFEYRPHILKEIRRVNRQFPGEIKLLGIFPSKREAEEICGRHVPLSRHLERCQEVSEALRQLGNG